MFSISTLLSRRARAFADSEKQNTSSAPGAILRHIDSAGKLRAPQVRAIETYLWIKFCGKNKCLADLVIGGYLKDSELAREHSCDDETYYQPLQQFLLIFARANDLKQLESSVLRDLPMKKFHWEGDLRKLLHDFPYPNYLYSLPMGAGKTYLMAAFIAIDLHFSRLLPKDDRFAHNFIVFAPHAAKTAILPSLKTIRAFDPNWVLPPAGADAVRREMRVEILDAAKSAKNSTRVNNPNLEKVNRLSQTHSRGLVFITNAEKVVLEKYEGRDALQAGLGMKEFADLKKINELRERMAEIPNLAVFLDEVHHAYQSSSDKQEKKLRDAVGVLSEQRNLRSVVGFSGTPFITQKVEVGGNMLRPERLQDVVYDFPLARGIGVFLKTPKVISHDGVKESAFVHSALDEFFSNYDREYDDGTKSKIAFYCPSIAVLNENILPAVQQWYAQHRAHRDDEIFSYYTASGSKKSSVTDCKKYPLPKNALAEFHNLDTSHSDKRVVLLVAVGKEGWDCRSLTAVALPRRETTKTFVLQAACRCLREVSAAANETALVCLGEGNYQIFSEQLKQNHRMSVDEFQSNDHSHTAPVVVRKPDLGELCYTQVKSRTIIESGTEKLDEDSNLAAFLRSGFKAFKKKHEFSAETIIGHIAESGAIAETVNTRAADDGPGEFAAMTFWGFLVELSQVLYGRISAADLSSRHDDALQKIHRRLVKEDRWFRSHPDSEEKMCRAVLETIAACFAVERNYRRDDLTEQTKIKLLDWKSAAPRIDWGGGRFLPEINRADLPSLHKRPERLPENLEDSELDPGDISFNYVPYRFDSEFERIAIRQMLAEECLRNFELYYNGMTDAGLESFQIRTRTGVYTPDFLLLKREGGRQYEQPGNGAPIPAKIEKVLIIETKGKPFHDEKFKAKERFIKGEFRKHNPNFRYFCVVDDSGRNNFAAHLGRLRAEVAKWADA